MENKCLFCYQTLDENADFHSKCLASFFGSPVVPKLPYSINQMKELAKEVIERSVTVPGVQAKLSMSLIGDTSNDKNARLTVVGALGGQYILKPPTAHFPEMPANEHLTMRIADAFGIRVVPSTLIRLESGELAYLTKRIDRNEKTGAKIHMLDMFQLTEAYDKYKSSMEKVGKALHNYSSNTLLDKLFLFELTVFCFLTGNNDMHLKNFSMIESASGWILSPAYDLLNVAIILPDDNEELALTLGGRKRKLKQEDFVKFGKDLGLSDKQIEGVFKRMQKNKPMAHHWIDNSFLSEQMKENYKKLLELRYDQLGINI